jgi:cytochrome c-type biogenesis protein CcmH
MIWIVFTLMVVAALAILVPPLVRAKAKAADRAGFDIAVYKDQLTEIDRDVERGVLTADQAEAARIEIQRRVLAAADGKGGAKAQPRRSVAAAVAVAVTVPAVAMVFYVLLGSPTLPDQPHAGRANPMEDMAQKAQMFRDMVTQLEAKLDANPSDGKGWAMMARSLRVLGEPEKAHEAYRKAMALMPTDAAVRLDYGSLLLDSVPRGAPLPAEFVGLMKDVLRLEPNQPDALYFSGIAEMQAGRRDKAKALWTRLLDQLPPGSEDRAEVIRMIEGL